MFTKKTLAVAAVIAALGTGAAGIGVTRASENPEGQAPKMMSELVAAIAEKFNLNEDEVQAVFDEQAEERREQMKEKHESMVATHNEKFDEMLAQAVEDGELTQSQADDIMEKRDEMQEFAASLVGESREDRREQMEEKRDAITDWAEENDIPERYVRFLPPPPQGGPGGRMGGGMMGGQQGPFRPANVEI